MFSRLKLMTRHSQLLRSSAVAPTTRSAQPALVSSPLLRFSRCCLSTSTTPGKPSTVVKRIPIPPNLHIDPRSSFITHETTTFVEEEKGDAEEEDTRIAPSAIDALEQELTYAIPLPDRLHVNVFDLQDSTKEIGTIWLDSNVFGRDPIRVDLLKRAVDYIRAKKRGRRKAVTKTISEVSGSGRKMRPQKGTGRARVGHKRPPHFRGGAKAHGPKNTTDYGNTKLNKKVRKQALCHALSQKLKEGNLILVNSLETSSLKTKELSRTLSQWEIGGREGDSALILDNYYPDENKDEEGNDRNDAAKDKTTTISTRTSYRGVPASLFVASRNIPKIQVGNTHAANVYELLRNVKLVLTLEAMTVLERRLKDF